MAQGQHPSCPASQLPFLPTLWEGGGSRRWWLSVETVVVSHVHGVGRLFKELVKIMDSRGSPKVRMPLASNVMDFERYLLN